MVEARTPFWRSDEALQRALADLAAHVDYPATPDVAGRVAERIRSEPVRRSGVFDWLRGPARPLALRRSLVLAVALTLLIVGAAIGLRLGFPGLRIIPVETLPPVPSVSFVPGPDSEIRLGLGAQTTLQAAQSAVPFTIRVPSAPGFERPDGVYLGYPPSTGRVELVYRVRDGLPSAGPSGVGMLVTQFQGRNTGEYAQKMIGPRTSLELVDVAGVRGYLISGAEHVLFYESDGDVQRQPARLVGNALIWERDGIVYRIESSLPKDQLLAIAGSIR